MKSMVYLVVTLGLFYVERRKNEIGTQSMFDSMSWRTFAGNFLANHPSVLVGILKTVFLRIISKIKNKKLIFKSFGKKLK